MTMRAYDEMYLEDAMSALAEMCDYAVNDCALASGLFWAAFSASTAGKQFGTENPKYVTGSTGIDLARKVWFEMAGEQLTKEPVRSVDKSPAYWAGRALAYYQWYRNRTFREMTRCGLGLSETISLYRLHEADLSKFVRGADQITDWMVRGQGDGETLLVEVCQNAAGERLKRLRKYYGMTQKKLSETSHVTLRMIQLYEQGQNDLSKAQAHVVLSLARALGCRVEDLIA